MSNAKILLLLCLQMMALPSFGAALGSSKMASSSSSSSSLSGEVLANLSSNAAEEKTMFSRSRAVDSVPTAADYMGGFPNFASSGGNIEISPDKRWIARCGSPEYPQPLQIQAFGTNSEATILAENVSCCAWSRDSKKIAYVQSNGRCVCYDLETKKSVEQEISMICVQHIRALDGKPLFAAADINSWKCSLWHKVLFQADGKVVVLGSCKESRSNLIFSVVIDFVAKKGWRSIHWAGCVKYGLPCDLAEASNGRMCVLLYREANGIQVQYADDEARSYIKLRQMNKPIEKYFVQRISLSPDHRYLALVGQEILHNRPLCSQLFIFQRKSPDVKLEAGGDYEFIATIPWIDADSSIDDIRCEWHKKNTLIFSRSVKKSWLPECRIYDITATGELQEIAIFDSPKHMQDWLISNSSSSSSTSSITNNRSVSSSSSLRATPALLGVVSDSQHAVVAIPPLEEDDDEVPSDNISAVWHQIEIISIAGQQSKVLGTLDIDPALLEAIRKSKLKELGPLKGMVEETHRTDPHMVTITLDSLPNPMPLISFTKNCIQRYCSVGDGFASADIEACFERLPRKGELLIGCIGICKQLEINGLAAKLVKYFGDTPDIEGIDLFCDLAMKNEKFNVFLEGSGTLGLLTRTLINFFAVRPRTDVRSGAVIEKAMFCNRRMGDLLKLQSNPSRVTDASVLLPSSSPSAKVSVPGSAAEKLALLIQRRENSHSSTSAQPSSPQVNNGTANSVVSLNSHRAVSVPVASVAQVFATISQSSNSIASSSATNSGVASSEAPIFKARNRSPVQPRTEAGVQKAFQFAPIQQPIASSSSVLPTAGTLSNGVSSSSTTSAAKKLEDKSIAAEKTDFELSCHISGQTENTILCTGVLGAELEKIIAKYADKDALSHGMLQTKHDGITYSQVKLAWLPEKVEVTRENLNFIKSVISNYYANPTVFTPEHFFGNVKENLLKVYFELCVKLGLMGLVEQMIKILPLEHLGVLADHIIQDSDPILGKTKSVNRVGISGAWLALKMYSRADVDGAIGEKIYKVFRATRHTVAKRS